MKYISAIYSYKRSMASCPFCGKFISVTHCQKYEDHINVCKKWYDAEKKVESLQKEVKVAKQHIYLHDKEKIKVNDKVGRGTSKQTIFNITGNVVFGNQYQQYNMAVFYPKTKMVMDLAIDQAKTMSIDEFDTPEKLDARMKEVQEVNDEEIVKLLNGTNLSAKKQLLSFLAEIMSIFCQRIKMERPQNREAIEAAEDFKEECIKDQKLITFK